MARMDILSSTSPKLTSIVILFVFDAILINFAQ
jgi:hypothetical protein